jgi:hypothetical protein
MSIFLLLQVVFRKSRPFPAKPSKETKNNFIYINVAAEKQIVA